MSQCRHCHKKSLHTFLDLGFAPPSNAYLSVKQLSHAEMTLPLHILVCDGCWLVQTKDYAMPEQLFSDDYAYFSSTSSSWLAHARHYCEQVTTRFELGESSQVIEIAANDGYLLKNFVAQKVPCLGIEPTAGTAIAAKAQGIPIVQEFFGVKLAKELLKKGLCADLLIGNNVYAHVPDINDFTQGLSILLKPEGVITLEFPHLLNLIKEVQFDTIYHEHFSYLCLHTVNTIFATAGLRIFDVEKLSTHGGSLRIYACHIDASHITLETVQNLLDEETENDLTNISAYQGFQEKVNTLKDEFLMFLIEQKKLGKKVVAYGAAAKGNTLLNYAGVRSDLLPVVYDAARSKQGKFLPGSHIPIAAPSELYDVEVDYILIFPWNIATEIMVQLAEHVANRTQFVTAVPYLDIR